MSETFGVETFGAGIDRAVAEDDCPLFLDRETGSAIDRLRVPVATAVDLHAHSPSFGP